MEKNLKALEKFPRVALNNIKDFPEAFKPVGGIFVGRSFLSAIRTGVASHYHLIISPAV